MKVMHKLGVLMCVAGANYLCSSEWTLQQEIETSESIFNNVLRKGGQACESFDLLIKRMKAVDRPSLEEIRNFSDKMQGCYNAREQVITAFYMLQVLKDPNYVLKHIKEQAQHTSDPTAIEQKLSFVNTVMPLVQAQCSRQHKIVGWDPKKPKPCDIQDRLQGLKDLLSEKLEG